MRPLGVQRGRRRSPVSDVRSLGTDKEGDESRVPVVLSKVLPVSRLDLFSVWFTPKGSTLRRLSLGFSRPRSLVGETRSTGNRIPNSFMATRTSFCFSRERMRAQSEACPVRVESVSSSEQSRVRREPPVFPSKKRDVLTQGHMLLGLLCWRSPEEQMGILWPQKLEKNFMRFL